jgi:hypothetical protein
MNKLCLGILLSVLTVSISYAQNLAVKSNLLYDLTGTLNVGGEYAITKNISAGLSLNWNGLAFGIKNATAPYDKMAWKHFLVQPEGRYWFRESFNGLFAGVHLSYMSYDIRRINISSLFQKDRSDTRTIREDLLFDRRYVYKGSAFGGGATVGYQLYLSPRLNVEFSLGFGMMMFSYDKEAALRMTGTSLQGDETKLPYYVPATSGGYQVNADASGNPIGYKEHITNRSYFGPTQLGVSVVYIIF